MTAVHAWRMGCIGRMGIACLTSMLASPCFAQAKVDYYSGLSIGQARASIDEPRITARLLADGLSTSHFARDEHDLAYRLFAGYQFNPNSAVELGVFGLGNFDFTATTVPAGTLQGRIKLQGVGIDWVGTLPLAPRWSALARLGAHSTLARDTFSGTGAVTVQNAQPRKREFNPKIGVGLQYQLTPSMWLRTEVERYRINDAVGRRGDVDVWSVSLAFPFGRRAN